MKKVFIKPVLHRVELQLNENIAASWKYYHDKGSITAVWIFHDLGGPNTTTGCYDLLTNNTAWPTSAYETGPYAGYNDPQFMTDWLLHYHIIEARQNDDPSDDAFAYSCYTPQTIPNT